MSVALENMPPGFAELVAFESPLPFSNDDPTFTLPANFSSRRSSSLAWGNSPIFASVAEKRAAQHDSVAEKRAAQHDSLVLRSKTSPSTSPLTRTLRSGSTVPTTARQTRSGAPFILGPVKTGKIDKRARYQSQAKPDIRAKPVGSAKPAALKPPKKKSGKGSHTPTIHEPLSVLTKHMTDVPVRDMEAWVNRPAEDRRKEPGTRKGAIARPMNSFMLYRSAYADRCKAWCDLNEHQVVSVVTGQSWQLEPEDIRSFYTKLADVERDNHQVAFPTYKFQPQKNLKLNKDDDNDSDDDMSRVDPDDDYRPKRGGRMPHRAAKRGSETPSRTFARESAPAPPHHYPEVQIAPPHLYGRANKRLHGQFINYGGHNYRPAYGPREGYRIVPLGRPLTPPGYQHQPQYRSEYPSPPLPAQAELYQEYQPPPPFQFEYIPEDTIVLDSYNQHGVHQPIYEHQTYERQAYAAPQYDPVLSYVGNQQPLTYTTPTPAEVLDDYAMIDPALRPGGDAMELQ